MAKRVGEYEFIYENSLAQRLKFWFAFASVVLVLGGIFFTAQTFARENAIGDSFFKEIRDFINEQIVQFTPVGLFFVGFISSLFFSFVPLEPSFYYGLVRDNPYVLSMLMIMAGLIPAELLNYVVGRKFSPLMKHFVSTRKLYGAKRFVNKHGSYGVFLFNFIPIFPSPILTFALGMVKYNPARLFFWLILADILKFIAIILFYNYLGAQLETFL